MGDADDEAEHRQNERAETVENVLSEVREDLGEQSYPTTSEELSETYADTSIGLPNETESLATAFGRIDDEFEGPDEAFEVLMSEYEGGEYGGGRKGRTMGEAATWSEDRADDAREPADESVESDRDRSVERARKAQEETSETDSDE